MGIGKYIPQFIKKPIIKLINLPGKIKWKIYNLASKGKIPFPDKLFQKWDYYTFTKKKLSLKNPKTYNEKLQWMKYYYRNPEYTKLVDKYEVRKFVEEKASKEILIPCLGIYEKWTDIDFTSLPEKFVIKCTHDSGSVVICKDKKNFDYKNAEEIIVKGLSRNQFYVSREWPYKNVPPRIIIERYLENKDGTSLVDYKLYCFDGKPIIITTLTGKNGIGEARQNYYDMDWNLLQVKRGKNIIGDNIPKPVNYDKMINLSQKLSKGFPHVRVDFIEENNILYFTELTFFPAGGRKPFYPDSFDKWLGDFLNLPQKMR